MIGNAGFLDDLRPILARQGSVTALRIGLLLFAVVAAVTWTRRRPLLALLTVSTGGFMGLAYWLVQIVVPLGLATNPELTRAWAQAGVNALAEPKGAGFIFGTESSISLVSALASAGVPLVVVALTPQLAVLLAFCFALVLPFAFLRSRTSAALAASLALSGGLWPGMAPYSSVLLRPSAPLVAAALCGMLLAVAQSRTGRRAFHRFRLEFSAVLLAAAVLDHATHGGTEPAVTSALLLGGTAVILTSPLRAAVRRTSASPNRARRTEALVLLCVFGGSGLFWWDPPSTVAGFRKATDKQAALQEPMDWIRQNVPNNDVVLASPAYSAPIAALAGRRVLFSPLGEATNETSLGEQPRREHLLESARLGQPLARLAEEFSVTHLLLGPGEPSPPTQGGGLTHDEPEMGLVLVYSDPRDFRVFRLERR